MMCVVGGVVAGLLPAWLRWKRTAARVTVQMHSAIKRNREERSECWFKPVEGTTGPAFVRAALLCAE